MPKKTPLPDTFQDRLRDALLPKGVNAKSPTEVGRFFGVNKQTADQWLKTGTVSSKYLFNVVDKLDVSARWLILGGDHVSKAVRLEPEEVEVIEEIYRKLKPSARAKWVRDGRELLALTTGPSETSDFYALTKK